MKTFELIKKPVVTEKSTAGIPSKIYTFKVDPKATKTDIKIAVEEIFKVKVARVNTSNYQGKLKRQGKTEGRRPSFKKAIVTLTPESKAIEFFESLA